MLFEWICVFILWSSTPPLPPALCARPDGAVYVCGTGERFNPRDGERARRTGRGR